MQHCSDAEDEPALDQTPLAWTLIEAPDKFTFLGALTRFGGSHEIPLAPAAVALDLRLWRAV
jgi:hypothetical protein